MQRKETSTPAVLFSLFCFLLLFAPLSFAASELWALAVLELGIGLLGGVFLFYFQRGRVEAVAVPGALPLLLLLCWMVFQVAPLPPWLVSLLSPGAVNVYEPVWQITEGAGRSEGREWISLSVNRKETLLETVRIASYALLYCFAVQLFANGRTLRKTVRIIVGCAVFLAFLAIIQHFTSPDHIYWFRSVPDKARIMGPWVNRGQFAGFMAMLFPLMMALFLYFRPKVDDEEPLRARIVEFFSSPGSNYQMILAFGCVVVLLSIMVSLSRAGMMIALVSIALFYFLHSRKRGMRSWPAILVFCIGLVLYFYQFGSEEFIGRINDSFTAEGNINFSRWPIWRDTVVIIRDYWLTGSGFGSFVDIFPMYRTIEGATIYKHAHNDYLELLAEGGVIGFSLAAWFVLAVLKNGWTMIKRRKDNYAVLLGIGSLVGISAMLLFALTDFNMHNGADGLYFFLLCALLVSCGNTRFQYRSSTTLLPEMGKGQKGIVACITAAVCLGAVMMSFRVVLAEIKYAEVKEVYLSRQLAETKLEELADNFRALVSLDPLEGSYRMVLGDIEKYRGREEAAFDLYLQAVSNTPLRGRFLQKAALMLPESEQELADKMMALSYERSMKKDAMVLGYVEWLLWRDKKDRATTILKKELLQTPELFDQALVLLNAYFSPEEVAGILPHEVEMWLEYGKFLQNLGDQDGSEYFQRHALDFVDNDDQVRTWWYSNLYHDYRRAGKEDEAVEILRLAAQRFPEEAFFHIRLGDYYRKQNIYYKAREEYEQALLFNPGNEEVLSRLESLDNR